MIATGHPRPHELQKVIALLPRRWATIKAQKSVNGRRENLKVSTTTVVVRKEGNRDVEIDC